MIVGRRGGWVLGWRVRGSGVRGVGLGGMGGLEEVESGERRRRSGTEAASSHSVFYQVSQQLLLCPSLPAFLVPIPSFSLIPPSWGARERGRQGADVSLSTPPPLLFMNRGTGTREGLSLCTHTTSHTQPHTHTHMHHTHTAPSQAQRAREGERESHFRLSGCWCQRLPQPL